MELSKSLCNLKPRTHDKYINRKNCVKESISFFFSLEKNISRGFIFANLIQMEIIRGLIFANLLVTLQVCGACVSISPIYY